jgi:hypothetical protein
MGGHGSGWRSKKKDVVEDCIVLSIDDLAIKAVVLAGGWRRGRLSWRYSNRDRPHAVIEYEVNLFGGDGGCVWLSYNTPGENVRYCISLISTAAHFGGRRWWFKCPVNGIRAAKLYLPPTAIRFASRQAHDLTYKSCQQSGQFNHFCRRIASHLGRDEADLRAILRG